MGQGPEQGFLLFIVFFVVLGLKLRAFTLSHSASPFVMGIIKIGSCEQFSWAGCKP
jgi:hypothetical protein